MRRSILQPREQFTNAHLKRTGAFNAQALTAATAIIEGVRERGDEALRAYTEQFDGGRVEEFRVSQAAIAEAIVNVDDKTARAWARRGSRWNPGASTCRAGARCTRRRC